MWGAAWINLDLNDYKLVPNSIGTNESFGTANVILVVSPTSIPTAESFGIPDAYFLIRPPSINSAELFGNSSIILELFAISIPSAEQQSSDNRIDLILGPSSILSELVFGPIKVTGGVTPKMITAQEQIDFTEIWNKILRLFSYQPNSLQTYTFGELMGMIQQIPDQTGNAGKFLQTDGANLSWAAGGGASTLSAIYAAGAAAADQTCSIGAVDGGPVLFKAGGAATGSLVKAQTSGSVDLVDFTDNSTQLIKSAMADGAAAIALKVDTTTAWANATAKLLSISSNNSEKLHVKTTGILGSALAMGMTTSLGTSGDIFTFAHAESRDQETFVLRNNSNRYLAVLPGTSNRVQMRFYEPSSDAQLGGFTVTSDEMTLFGAAGGPKNLVPNNDATCKIGTTALRFGEIHAVDIKGVRNSIGTAQTTGNGLRIANETAAAAGAQQFSPLVELEGQGWKTNATAASQSCKMALQTRPVQGAAQPESELVLWSSVNAGAYTEVFRFYDDSVTSINNLRSKRDAMLVLNNSANGIYANNNAVFFYVGDGRVACTSSAMYSQTDGAMANGDSTHRWKETWSRVYATEVGSPLASGASISPDRGIHHITGTSEITTINLPVTGFVGTIVLIPDEAFTFNTGGNIAVAGTAVVNRALHMTFDGTSWYPSYV